MIDELNWHGRFQRGCFIDDQYLRPWLSRVILGIRAKVIQTAGGVLIIYGERVGNEDC
jgi:hypothetical protein